MIYLNIKTTLLFFTFLLFSFCLNAQFYPDTDNDGLGSAWHSNTSSVGVTNNLDADDSNASVGLSLSMPPALYGVVNQTVEIYYRNLFFVETANLSGLTYQISSSAPSATNGSDKWSFTPNSSGTYTLTLTVQLGSVTIGTGTSTLFISPDSKTGTNQREITMFGHSYVAGGYQLLYLNQYLAGGNNPSYALVGRQNIWVSPTIHHDGYAAMGWDFFTGSSSPIKNGSSYDMQGYYDAINGGNPPEYIVIELDVNDFLFNGSMNQTYTSVANIDAVILNQWNTNATPVVNALKYSGCTKIALTITPPPSENPSHAASHNVKLIQLIQKRIAYLATSYWGGREGENIYLIPMNTAINTASEYEDILHPSNAVGYNKVAQQIYSWLKYQFQSSQSCGINAITWIGGTGNWNQTTNWSCTCIPTAADHVIFDGITSVATVPASYTAYTDSILLKNSAQLNVAANGALTLGARGITLESNSKITAMGTVLMGNGSIINNQATVQLNNGTLSGTASLLNQSTATISGNGTIALNTTDKGTLSPGSSAGALLFSGTVNKSQGSYFAEIASATSYDQITVNGVLTLNGTLNVTLLNSFMPASGEIYDVLMYPAGKIGTFQNILLPNISPNTWSVSYLSDRLRLTVNGVLPLDLVQFEAKSTKNGVQLVWKTVTEQGISNFEIERQNNGQWKTIQSVKAIGSIEAETNYSFLDKNAPVGKNYFRLNILDWEQSSSYSQIVAVQQGQIAPNWWLSKEEQSNQMYVHWPKEDALLDVQVFSIEGRLILDQKTITASTLAHIGLHLPSEGLFVVKIISDSGVYSKRI